MTDTRPIPCEHCGGDGGHEWIDWYQGAERAQWSVCTACNGTGDEWIAVEPIEMEDLP